MNPKPSLVPYPELRAFPLAKWNEYIESLKLLDALEKQLANLTIEQKRLLQNLRLLQGNANHLRAELLKEIDTAAPPAYQPAKNFTSAERSALYFGLFYRFRDSVQETLCFAAFMHGLAGRWHLYGRVKIRQFQTKPYLWWMALDGIGFRLGWNPDVTKPALKILHLTTAIL